MQIQETVNEGLKRGFKVTIPAETVNQAVDGELKKVGQKVKLPGFRPGKVPMQILKQRYLGEVLGQVVNESINQATGQLLEERSLRPASQPKVEITQFEPEGDLEYTVDIEVVPDVTVPDFAAISLERPVAPVTEERLQEELTRLADANKTFVAIEEARPCQDGDTVQIDFHGTVDGEAREGMHAHDHDMELGSGRMIPGFEEQVVGMSAGDSRDITVTFPEDYHAEDLRGVEAVFKIDLKAIKQAQVPAVDDAFAKEVLGTESLDDLKTKLGEMMGGELKKITRDVMKRRLLDVLNDLVAFPLPESLVNQEFDQIWTNVQRAIDADQLDEEDKGKDVDTLKGEYRAIAERRVRLGLLLAQVGEQNNIEVEQADLQRAVMAEARQYPGREMEVFKFFQENPEQINRLRAPIFEDKVIDYILELVQVTETEVTEEQLKEMATAPD